MAQEAKQEEAAQLKEFADLGDELVKYVGALKLERETKKQISRFVYEMQATLSKPVELEPGPLSKWFPGADSAVLLDGENLVIRQGEKETTVSLLRLEPDPYFAVVKEVAVAVGRLMTEEETRRADKLRPALQVSTRLIGRRLAVFDWRGYKLVIANMGGRARGTKISVSTAGKEWYGPFNVEAMGTKEVALHHFYRIQGSKTLKVTVRCKDDDGRTYAGEVELKPESNEVNVFRLVEDPFQMAPAAH